MKLILLFLTMITVVASAPSDDWKAWKLKYGKTYNDTKEEALRQKIFWKNVQRVNDHNAAYERGETTYQQIINRYADLTDDEFVSQMTGIVLPDDYDKN